LPQTHWLPLHVPGDAQPGQVSVVPHVSEMLPHAAPCWAHVFGVQQLELKHTAPPPHVLQVTVPPQPSLTEPQAPAGHCEIGVQHWPLLQTSPVGQLQAIVPPQPSFRAAPQALAGHFGVQPQTPLSQGPRAQSPSAVQSSPGSHVAPQLPPQSTSVSSAFWTPSSHRGGRHC
jgi:hypothetical protein